MRVIFASGFALFLAGCGGNVVVDKGGTSSTTGSTSTSTTITTSTTLTGVSCTDHKDCPEGVCIFSTGTCSSLCGNDFCPSCGPGMVCDSCATSSCPECDNCIWACTPITAGRCDSDDPCPAGEVCIFQDLRCAPACQSDDDCGGFAFCADCVTSSCCACEDCKSACVGGE